MYVCNMCIYLFIFIYLCIYCVFCTLKSNCYVTLSLTLQPDEFIIINHNLTQSPDSFFITDHRNGSTSPLSNNANVNGDWYFDENTNNMYYIGKQLSTAI